MTQKEALTILQEMQKWRRGETPFDGDTPDTHKTMPFSPKEFGEAIDYAIGYIITTEGTDPFYTLQYRTEWTDCDNYVISLYERGNRFQIGIVEVRINKTGERKGEGYIWNLSIGENHRGKGYGRYLLREAVDVVMCADCKKASLEWDKRDSPYWVYDWYEREGFAEKVIGNGYAYMVKEIEEKKEL